MRYTSNIALLRSKMGVSNFLPIILANDASSCNVHPNSINVVLEKRS
jgi:hypothetical protein